MQCALCAVFLIRKTVATRIRSFRERNVAQISRNANRSRPEISLPDMTFVPANVAELTSLLAEAHTHGRKVEAVNLNALNRVLEHTAEDMTATVQAGITLKNFQQQLGSRGQWLPIDPYGEGLTI